MNEQDEHKLIAQRREKLAELRQRAQAFPSGFHRDALAADLHARHDDEEGLEDRGIRATVGGRMMAKRIMGKAAFTRLQDMSGSIQLFLQRDLLGTDVYSDFKHWDVGDIIGASGILFHTRTGELSIKVDRLVLLSKSLRPLPEKWHGLTDQEQRFRQRYVDLVMNPEVRRVFEIRAAMIAAMRGYLAEQGFLEVETPMMQSIPGGAAARPFVTHHNALDLDLYLRVAPELYLKRLVVGGLEKVFEINRNFRNEGLSTRHNPEFTMLEFYEAYADYRDGMDHTEALLKTVAREVMHSDTIRSGDDSYDLGRPFARLGLREAVLSFNPGLESAAIDDRERCSEAAGHLGIQVDPHWTAGRIEAEIFERTVEHRLHDPTFITHYPIEVSPLARRNDQNPAVTDRFELIVGGRELANGFSELNDPEEQAERFRLQVAARDSGDAEAMHYDGDYIRALEYGMPPASGVGLGIDRVAMLFTDSASIRDVILFPQMRPESSE